MQSYLQTESHFKKSNFKIEIRYSHFQAVFFILGAYIYTCIRYIVAFKLKHMKTLSSRLLFFGKIWLCNIGCTYLSLKVGGYELQWSHHFYAQHYHHHPHHTTSPTSGDAPAVPPTIPPTSSRVPPINLAHNPSPSEPGEKREKEKMNERACHMRRYKSRLVRV